MGTEHPFSILLAEDEANASEILSSVLEVRYPDASIYKTADGRAALDSFREHLPDIVITDIHMPELDGVQLISSVCSIKPETGIIVVTAHSDKMNLDRITAVEASIELIHKPINFEQLFALIDRHRM